MSKPQWNNSLQPIRCLRQQKKGGQIDGQYTNLNKFQIIEVKIYLYKYCYHIQNTKAWKKLQQQNNRQASTPGDDTP